MLTATKHSSQLEIVHHLQSQTLMLIIKKVWRHYASTTIINHDKNCLNMNRSLIQYCYVPDSDCSVMEGVFGWSWQDSDTLLHADSLSFINHSLSAWRENRSGLFTECRGCLATWWYSVINNNPLCLCFISHFSLVALFLFASQDDWLSDKHCKFGRMRDAGVYSELQDSSCWCYNIQALHKRVSAGGRWQAHTGFITVHL